MSKIVIVNENNEVIGSKERLEVRSSDIYRTTGLWITNSKGQVLLAQRSFKKSHDPGRWGPAVSGTVEEGESYDENIKKEAWEELGIEGLEFEKGPIKYTQGNHNRFSQWYFLKLDRNLADFTVQYEEVERIKWFDKNELIQDIKDKPDNFLQSMPERVKMFLTELRSK
ncbi:MAG: NUDIX domain-containing protein [Patescibacteria group bacterium]